MENSSLRSVGKSMVGRLHKGTLYSNDSKQEPSPLLLSLAESNLLSDRFEFSNPADFLPSHSSPGPAVHSSLELSSPSFSKKGYGGLISKSKRFNNHQYTTQSPGPGTYQQPLPLPKSISSVFAQPSAPSLQKLITPPPGTYNPKILKNENGSQSAFKSKTKRLEIISSDAPPPWQYSPMLPSKSVAVIIHRPSNFKKRVVDPYEPFREMVSEQIYPGPGEYEILKSERKGRPSPMFKGGNIDRFGKRLEETGNNKLGPGEYFSENNEVKVPVTHSVFLSNTKRNVLDNKHIPGPAYYSPKALDKKRSFLVNLNNVWN